MNSCSIVSQHQPLVSCPPHFASQFRSLKQFSPRSCTSFFIQTTKLRPRLYLSDLRRSPYFPSPLLHPPSRSHFIYRDRNILIDMTLKRKATDAGSSTSPLKKRNAVTAGIGRAAESEGNGIGFGYYGRTDDREDVS